MGPTLVGCHWGKACSIFCVLHPQRLFHTQEHWHRELRQGCYCLFLSAGWELRSCFLGTDLDCLRSQADTVGLVFVIAYDYPDWSQDSCAPSWCLCPRLHLPMVTNWFNKYDHFLCPHKKSHFGNFFNINMFVILNWTLILFKASSISPCSTSVLSVSTIWTWLFFLLVWFGEILDTCYLPRCGLKSLTLHLSLGAQPAPLPNRALSPFPFLGPRCVTLEKAQGPGPFPVFCGLCSCLPRSGSTSQFCGVLQGGERSLISCHAARNWLAHGPWAFSQDGT